MSNRKNVHMMQFKNLYRSEGPKRLGVVLEANLCVLNRTAGEMQADKKDKINTFNTSYQQPK